MTAAVTYYHATPLARVAKILRRGLLPRRYAPIGHLPPQRHVFVFDNLESSVEYALRWHWRFDDAVLEIEAPSSWFERDPIDPINPHLDPPGAWRTNRAIPPDRIRAVLTFGVRR